MGTAGNDTKEKPAKARKREPMKQVTIRIFPSTYKIIQSAATESKMSLSQFVRITMARELHRYLGEIKFENEEQGEEIKKTIKALLDTTSKIHSELHRIGINYNQQIRLLQIERKHKNDGMDFYKIEQKRLEIKKVEEECGGFSREELDNLITRYEQATKQVGDILCRILA